jgi:hypothetical protein
MKKHKMTREEARKLAEKQGIDFSKGFFVLNNSQVVDLLAIAKLQGYQKPKNAYGSKGRCFFYYLARVK